MQKEEPVSIIVLAIFAMANFCVLLGLWFLYTATPKLPELLAGIAAALIATVATALVQGQNFARFRPKLKWLLLFLLEPWYVMTGSWDIFVALIKRILGMKSEAQLKAVHFDAGAAEDSNDAARRALAIALTTIPPNFIVIGIDIKGDLMLIHQVSPSATPFVAKRVGAKE